MYECEPMRNMHEAKRCPEKNDADHRTAISSASNVHTLRLWARAALFSHAAALGSSGTHRAFCGSAVARAVPVEHFSAPGLFGAALIDHSMIPGQTREALFEYFAAEQTRRRHFDPYGICSSKAVPSCRFEPNWPFRVASSGR